MVLYSYNNLIFDSLRKYFIIFTCSLLSDTILRSEDRIKTSDDSYRRVPLFLEHRERAHDTMKFTYYTRVLWSAETESNMASSVCFSHCSVLFYFLISTALPNGHDIINLKRSRLDKIGTEYLTRNP
jgi:hypothetical protein